MAFSNIDLVRPEIILFSRFIIKSAISCTIVVREVSISGIPSKKFNNLSKGVSYGGGDAGVVVNTCCITGAGAGAGPRGVIEPSVRSAGAGAGAGAAAGARISGAGPGTGDCTGSGPETGVDWSSGAGDGVRFCDKKMIDITITTKPMNPKNRAPAAERPAI